MDNGKNIDLRSGDGSGICRYYVVTYSIFRCCDVAKRGHPRGQIFRCYEPIFRCSVVTPVVTSMLPMLSMLSMFRYDRFFDFVVNFAIFSIFRCCRCYDIMTFCVCDISMFRFCEFATFRHFDIAILWVCGISIFLFLQSFLVSKQFILQSMVLLISGNCGAGMQLWLRWHVALSHSR